MKRTVSIVLLLAMASTAVADPHKIVVLQTEGRADTATRSSISASLVRLASTGSSEVSSGDITFTDAAAGVGCNPDQAACRDEILGMLTVDEVVYATTILKPGGTQVEAQRVTRGGVSRELVMYLATGQSADNLLAPLFTDPVVAPPVAPPVDPGQPGLPAANDPTPSPITTQPVGPNVQADIGPSPNRARLQLAGIVGGTTLAFIGFLLWGEAGTIQEEIDTHPTNTAAQLEDLKRLEERGDSYAAWGNFLFLGGTALAGVSAYFYVKGRRARAAAAGTARIAPAVFDHGAGITLTIGGSP